MSKSVSFSYISHDYVSHYVFSKYSCRRLLCGMFSEVGCFIDWQPADENLLNIVKQFLTLGKCCGRSWGVDTVSGTTRRVIGRSICRHMEASGSTERAMAEALGSVGRHLEALEGTANSEVMPSERDDFGMCKTPSQRGAMSNGFKRFMAYGA